ncbi:MAG: thioredoxin family protein [Thermoplasmata archaeon]|nr:thioredoxin family protein [Thermoplasmata archaeon]
MPDGPANAMRVLTQAERTTVRATLGRQPRGPELHLFIQPLEWDTCRLARELCEELVSLEGRTALTVHDFQSERATARRFGVTAIPSVVPSGDGTGRVRFRGVPLGHQFDVLLEDLAESASRTSQLLPSTLHQLGALRGPLNIQVFASADCPYSPRTVRLAHQLAFASPLVEAEMVSVVEFPELADRFKVESLPTVVVNDGSVQFEGALAEPAFVDQVIRASGMLHPGSPPRPSSSGPPAPRRRERLTADIPVPPSVHRAGSIVSRPPGR